MRLGLCLHILHSTADDMFYSKYGMFDTSYDVAADFESLFRFIFINRIKTHYIPIDFVTMRVGGYLFFWFA